MAISELAYYREIPDALGWRWETSILIECKVSRADFLRDQRKDVRSEPGKGLGDYRFYLCRPGVIRPDDLPPRWGLLYLEGNSVRKIVFPAGYFNMEGWSGFKHEANKEMEMCILVAVARRLRDECPFIRSRLR